MTVEELIELYRSDDRIAGAAVCASVRRGAQDCWSDYDLWVFLPPNTELTSRYVWSELIPEQILDGALDEGRDDSWADYVVLNIMVDGVILNLKFLRMELFTDFCREEPSWDLDYMENLENYWTMDVRFDKGGLLAAHKLWLENGALRRVGEVLVPELLRRYAIHYWRSVYQGVLRDEELTWTHQVFYLCELLVALAHLKADRLPPCRKWILSGHSLDGIGTAGKALAEVLRAARRADITDKRAVLEIYALLAPVEDELIDLELTGWTDQWWRRVLDERMANHQVPADLTRQIADVMRGHLREVGA
ncbi:hypothetical protein ACFC6U_18405 [Kitasatospora purpeofusca]|uniref:hypothetical protein n=1 Tax=Kitasatospora purpeofusca TaxID=67352 RepID=UPI0035D6628A